MLIPQSVTISAQVDTKKIAVETLAGTPPVYKIYVIDADENDYCYVTLDYSEVSSLVLMFLAQHSELDATFPGIAL